MAKHSIAILGANGALGAPVLAALESSTFRDSFQKPAILITRNAADKKNTDAVEYRSGDLVADPEGVAETIKGVDVVISLLGFTPEVSQAAEKLVSIVKPKLYIPSQFGVDVSSVQSVFPGFLLGKKQHSDALRSKGIKVVDISTSCFAGDAWLYEINFHFGVDQEHKSVTYLGSPEQRVAFTHLIDVGRTVAAVATADPAQLPDKIEVQSGVVTPKQVVELWESRHGSKIEVKAVISKEQALKDAQEDWTKNGFQPQKFFYYLNVIISQDGLVTDKNDNELVNPGESLWKWEKF